MSSPFSNWHSLKSAFQQATIALAFNPNELAELDSKSAMNYMVSEVAAIIKGSEITHPALNRLLNYDSLHSTQFYKTLYEFLKNERNLVKTAADLFIHRNSMVYRIDRIKEIVDADFDDPKVRFHILLSYLCEEAGKTTTNG
ncbi:MAG: helix-turn-helix domain-containing protein [Eubacteriales bacterium]|nr:helix-turn-helix domain-containing protein [Eubacteriales bacterium]